MKARLLNLLLGSTVFASPGVAQLTHLDFEASADRGATWASAVTAEPGREVAVRVRVRFDAAGTSAMNLGLAGITFQPVLHGWSGTDRVLPFEAALPAGSPGYGRVYPYSSVAQGPGSASGGLTAFVEGTTLRIAGANNVTPTTDRRWGVVSAQSPQSLNPTGFSTSLDAIVFRWGFVVGDGPARTLTASAPFDWINNIRGTWYSGQIDVVQGVVLPETIHPAVVTIVPGAGGAAWLAGLGLWWGWRRTRTSAP